MNRYSVRTTYEGEEESARIDAECASGAAMSAALLRAAREVGKIPDPGCDRYDIDVHFVDAETGERMEGSVRVTVNRLHLEIESTEDTAATGGKEQGS